MVADYGGRMPASISLNHRKRLRVPGHGHGPWGDDGAEQGAAGVALCHKKRWLVIILEFTGQAMNGCH